MVCTIWGDRRYLLDLEGADDNAPRVRKQKRRYSSVSGIQLLRRTCDEQHESAQGAEFRHRQSLDRCCYIFSGSLAIDRMIDPSIMLDGKPVTETYPNSMGVPPNGDVEQAGYTFESALREISKPSDLPTINYVCMDSPVHKQYAEALRPAGRTLWALTWRSRYCQFRRPSGRFSQVSSTYSWSDESTSVDRYDNEQFHHRQRQQLRQVEQSGIFRSYSATG